MVTEGASDGTVRSPIPTGKQADADDSASLEAMRSSGRGENSKEAMML